MRPTISAAVDGRLLIVHALSSRAAGEARFEGALLDPTTAARLAGNEVTGARVPFASLDAVTDSANAESAWPDVEIVVGSDAADAPFPVVNGVLGARPAAVVAQRGWSTPVVLFVAAIGLLLLGGTTAWQMVRANRKTRDATAARAEFVTAVTHELRTPLASIRLLAERLALEHVRHGEKGADYASMVSGEATRLSVLVENVLDLGRIDRGERGMDRGPVVLAEVVEHTTQMLAPLARSSGVEWRIERGADDSAVVVGDAEAMRQALANVLDNARKYAPKAPVFLSIHRSSNRVMLDVTDGGAGVPMEDRELVFNRFARGRTHRDGGIPGVGLGLHLARALMRRMGGDLSMIDVPVGEGTGARFRFTFEVWATDSEPS